MSYAFPAQPAVQPAVQPVGFGAGPSGGLPGPPVRRPATVTAAMVVLAGMAVVGLGYAALTLVVTPGVVGRFRATAGAEQSVAESASADGYVTALWVGAGIATVLAIIVFALYSALALGLRGGSPVARIATWAVCGLGLVGGCGSAAVVAAQRSGTTGSDGLLVSLGAAYPAGWIELNLGLSVAQMLGYLVVAGLLLASPGAFFRRDGVAQQPLPPLPVSQPSFPYYSPPVTPAPLPGPDDQYWARPS